MVRTPGEFRQIFLSIGNLRHCPICCLQLGNWWRQEWPWDKAHGSALLRCGRTFNEGIVSTSLHQFLICQSGIPRACLPTTCYFCIYMATPCSGMHSQSSVGTSASLDWPQERKQREEAAGVQAAQQANPLGAGSFYIFVQLTTRPNCQVLGCCLVVDWCPRYLVEPSTDEADV